MDEAKRITCRCRLCGLVASFPVPWQGRPQGPQCQCNPNTWGNWERIRAAATIGAAQSNPAMRECGDAPCKSVTLSTAESCKSGDLSTNAAGWSMTLAERIEQLVAQHGSLRAVARVTEIDVGYLSRLRSGEKAAPEKDKLRRLGLRRVVTYELIGAAPREEGGGT